MPKSMSKEITPEEVIMKMSKYVSRDVQMENAFGGWVPAIQEPYYLGGFRTRVRCDCGKVYRNKASYRDHFAYAHILGMESDHIPETLPSNDGSEVDTGALS